MQPLTRFRHYKGGIYTYLHTTKHTETEEELVCYQDAEGGLWSLPLVMWNEEVEYQGVRQQRFVPLPSQRGKFYVFEGIDRSGKTTLSKAFASRLPHAKWISFPDRTTAIGKLLNDYLASKAQLPAEAVHLLFSANRWECQEQIRKLLDEGTTVVCDRYWYSGAAYSIAKRVSHDFAVHCDQDLIQPDRVFYLSITPEDASQRGAYGEERYERIDFQRQVTAAYESILALLKPEVLSVLDARLTTLELLEHLQALTE